MGGLSAKTPFFLLAIVIFTSTLLAGQQIDSGYLRYNRTKVMASRSVRRLVLVDAFGVMFQQFHAVKYPMSTKSGLPTGALHGYCRLILHSLEHLQPTHAACVLEGGGGSRFREKILPSYKANRGRPDDELKQQISHMVPLAKRMGIASICKAGHEADDVIATLAHAASRSGFDSVVIISNDKDLLQLVKDESAHIPNAGRVVVCKPKVEAIKKYESSAFDSKGVMRQMGVLPSQIPDYLSLVGDSSDNIPGVPSIGPKRAQKLLAEYKTLRGLIEAAEKDADFVLSSKLRSKIVDHWDIVKRNIDLVTLRTDLNLGGDEEVLHSLRVGMGRPRGEAEADALGALEEYEFSTLQKHFDRVLDMGIFDQDR